MFRWAKQQLADVAGTQEPIYGPEALRSVAEEAKTTPYTELTREDHTWKVLDSTNVETKSFYIFGDNGLAALAQVIYSNVAGIRTTGQFNSKIFYPDGSKPHLWCSTPLSNMDFSDDKTGFYADDCAMELSEDETYYTIKSMTSAESIVNLKITRTAPGFQVGKTGQSLFGTDFANPRGVMRHAFWPRCVAEGTITTKEGAVDFKGRAFFSYALQGGKPHHLGARWTFCDFQGPRVSAIMMEFTTPPSYGSSVVNVGGIARDGEIVVAGSPHKATHVRVGKDAENDWPEPEAVRFEWAGKTKDGRPVEAVLEGELGERSDRVDVMAEVPGFVKKIVAGAAGTKPYIYQYLPHKTKLTLRLKVGDEETIETGELFSEATFITE